MHEPIREQHGVWNSNAGKVLLPLVPIGNTCGFFVGEFACKEVLV
jgi:hypothetical protein